MKHELVRIADLGVVVGGGTPKTSVPEYWGGPIPWVTPAELAELQDPYVLTTRRTITESGLTNSGAQVLPPGSVLLSSRAPIGHVAINQFPVATNQGFKSIVPNREIVDPLYLYWWLKKSKGYLQSIGNGATFKEISKSVLERVLVPVASLREQQDLILELSEIEAVRLHAASVADLSAELTRSRLAEFFE